MTLQETITASAEYLLTHVTNRPTVALILGSGLGDFADTLENPVRVPYKDIPNFPQTTVAGHNGAFVFGRRCGREVVALQGRLHYYEGYSQQTLTLPIRVLAAMGVKQLVLTNAAGGVNTSFSQGCLMLISDHINYSGQNPLIGPNLDAFGPGSRTFPTCTPPNSARNQGSRRCSGHSLGGGRVHDVHRPQL